MTDYYPIAPPARNPHRLTAALEDLVGLIPSWTDEAICAQVEPDLWFPHAGENTNDPKQVCAGCPVRVKCLQHALDNDERWGVWGGLTASERRRLLKGRAA